MLILCSNGLSSLVLRSELKKRLQKSGNAAIVVTADNIYKKKDHHLPRLEEELGQLGSPTELVDIDETPPELLLNYDIVEFIGGNPFYLIDSIRLHNAETILQTISEDRTLIGISAAAFAFGPSLELVHEYSPELNTVGLKDLSGLKLTMAEVLPHYSRYTGKFHHFEERCREYESRKSTKVIRLNDGDALMIEGNAHTIIRA